VLLEEGDEYQEPNSAHDSERRAQNKVDSIFRLHVAICAWKAVFATPDLKIP
jgi:hypothetical protein